VAPSPPNRRAFLLGVSTLVAAIGILFVMVSAGSNGLHATGGGGTYSSRAAAGSAATHGAQLVFSGRDPFQPFPGGSTPPASPGPTPSVSPAGTPPPAPGGGSSASIGGHMVVLDDIVSSGGQKKAQVEVDGVVYTVAPGGRFADNFQLTSITGSCGDFLFGDQAFTLCVTAHK